MLRLQTETPSNIDEPERLLARSAWSTWPGQREVEPLKDFLSWLRDVVKRCERAQLKTKTWQGVGFTFTDPSLNLEKQDDLHVAGSFAAHSFIVLV